MSSSHRGRTRLAHALLLGTLLWSSGCGHEDLGRPFDSGGVYVQNVTTEAATIAGVTATPSRWQVELGPVTVGAQPPVLRESDPQPVRLHGLRFEGLAADTVYRWTVEQLETNEILDQGRLRTAPRPGARAITFVAVGDSGAVRHERIRLPFHLQRRLVSDPPRRQARLVRTIVETTDPDLVLHLGDVVYMRGERRRYDEAFFAPFRPLLERVPIYATIGNHDADTERAAPLLEVFHLPRHGDPADPDSERYYSFDYGDVHLVCLDSETSPIDAGSAQIAWLENDLAAATARWTVVFLHRPPFSRGRHRNTDRLQEALVPVLAAHHVDLVLSGHDHNYQRFDPIDGVHYVVAGAGGKSIYGVRPGPGLAAWARAPSFVVVQASATELRLEACSIAGETIDELVLDGRVRSGPR